MAGKKQDDKARGTDARRETRPRGEFEKQAEPQDTNRDHPDAAGTMKTAPGAGIVSAGREPSVQSNADAGERSTSRAASIGGGIESKTGATEPFAPRMMPPNDSAGDAAPETNDPNYSARRVHRAAPRDAGVNRMDTSGRGAQHPATHAANPRLVRDVMTADVEVCNPDTEMYYVGRMMMERDCGAIPVVESTDSMRPVGIITDRDIVVRLIAKNQNPLGMRARDCMSSDLALVAADAPVEECVLMMEERQLRRCLVVDNTGRLCGIVAQADVVRMRDEQVAAELLREVSEPNMQQDQLPPPT